MIKPSRILMIAGIAACGIASPAIAQTSPTAADQTADTVQTKPAETAAGYLKYDGVKGETAPADTGQHAKADAPKSEDGEAINGGLNRDIIRRTGRKGAAPANTPDVAAQPPKPQPGLLLPAVQGEPKPPKPACPEE